MPRRQKNELPKYLTEQEIEALFRVIKDPRDRAIFRLVYHRGLRGSEVGKLDLKDYRPAIGRLYVHRLKGSVSAEYHLTEAEISALKGWLRVRGQAPGPLFPSRHHRAISRRRLDQIMKQYCRAAGLPEEKAHCHSLKHSCGTHVLKLLNGDLSAVQDHLGHADIRSTQIYAKFTQREESALRLKDWGRKAA